MNNDSTDVSDYSLHLATKHAEARQLAKEKALETIRNHSKDEEDFELLITMLGYYENV